MTIDGLDAKISRRFRQGFGAFIVLLVVDGILAKVLIDTRSGGLPRHQAEQWIRTLNDGHAAIESLVTYYGKQDSVMLSTRGTK